METGTCPVRCPGRTTNLGNIDNVEFISVLESFVTQPIPDRGLFIAVPWLARLGAEM